MAEIVDLPMKMVNGDFPGRYVTVYQRVWVAWMGKWSNSTVDVPALFDYWRVHMIQDLPIQCHVTLLHDQLVIHFVWSGPLVLARSFWHAYTPPFLPWLIRSSSRECVHIVIYLFIMHIYRCLINDILYTTYPWFIISLYYMYIYICIYNDLYQWSQCCSSWISSPFPQSRRSLLISSLSPPERVTSEGGLSYSTKAVKSYWKNG